VTKVAHRFGRSGFGDNPADYARARPSYPQPLYDTLIQHCGLGPGCRVLEVGPGTGTATTTLLAAGAASLHAIEPDPRLAAFLRDVTPNRGLTIDQSPFEHADIPAQGFDLAIAATSFHWVRQKPGLRKAYAALKPGGWWAMWWTHFGSGADDPFQAATQHLFAAIQPQTAAPNPRPPFDLDRPARLRDLASAGFIHAQASAWQVTEPYDTARLVALYRTVSVIRALDPAAQADFLTAIARIATDNFGGQVERRFTTTLYIAQRPPHRSPRDQPAATDGARRP
jgi:SAM-dependent methyltransferase